MTRLTRRSVRWPLEAAMVLVLIPLVGVFVNASRECTTGEPFNLPASCSTSWVAAVMAGAAVLVVAVEVVAAVRHRLGSRPCPRCGARVRVGVLECADCGFDFRSVGAQNETSPARRSA